jgi:hypothetical protein
MRSNVDNFSGKQDLRFKLVPSCYKHGLALEDLCVAKCIILRQNAERFALAHDHLLIYAYTRMTTLLTVDNLELREARGHLTL